ncbi:type V CRISPR-associated protein Cas4 [Synergistes jonesii]|uniref:DUF83 domain-containing protein n=1 Tax=Synergistes jonesii TaxID=2754 RepID=A0A073IPA7_9BACT|nr:type V CRISPR-associated protein Cas4 [Synergistes jonesii]KEJ92203.1 hypothetical protein EH55_04130 [Synergistes jonesii]
MDDIILFSQLNDFIFCPISIYFHNLYGKMDTMLFQNTDQINGTNAHEAIDKGRYSTKKKILQGASLYCERYRLCGKLDTFDIDKGILTERKKKITTVYDGYIFQLYAQYFSLTEAGYAIRQIRLYSLDDNKVFQVKAPNEDTEMLARFENTIKALREFQPEGFIQTNTAKCGRCIYEPACDRSALAQ